MNKSPNLLFIYTDEQAINTLAAYGNKQIEMPNLNRLSEQSTVFEQTYVTQPVCTPSRSTLLTGQYPHTNGCTENNIPLRQDTTCLPEMLVNGKYATAHFGKWHLGDELFAQHGFDKWISIEDNYNNFFTVKRDKETRSSYHDFLVANGFKPKNGEIFSRNESARLPEKYSKPAFLAQESSRFIQEHTNEPFALYVNFLEPHMPFFSPRDNQYNPDEIPLPPNFDVELGDGHPLKTSVFAKAYYEVGSSGLPLKTKKDWQKMIANYWGLCSLIDTYIGKILDTLDKCNLSDNTIVVFTSDHGDMMGSHSLIAKCVMFEEAVRVPFIIRLPGQKEGQRIKGPVSQVDIIPTLLDYMNQPLPEDLQGMSLRNILDADAAKSDRSVYIEWNGYDTGILGDKKEDLSVPDFLKDELSHEQLDAAVSDTVRTVITPDGWKYNWSLTGMSELYNLEKDPGERDNLVGNPKYNTLINELQSKIVDWQKMTGDKLKFMTSLFF